jgi:hypothetical protein
MNLQRIRGHSSFIGFMGFADHESIAFPIVEVDGWVVSFVMSLTVSLGEPAARNVPVDISK